MPDRIDERSPCILVGSDLSSASDRVVREAARLAVASDASLHVVSAFDEAWRVGDGGRVPESVMHEITQALPAQLRRILPASVTPASAEVRFGKPSTVLLDRAREVKADVIVLGPHRGPDVPAQFLGTTADAVLVGATVPCVVIRGRLNLPVRVVGVALDLEGEHEDTLETALDFALQTRTSESPETALRLHVLHVAPPDEKEDRAQFESAVEALKARVRNDYNDQVEVTSEILVGIDPADEIVDWTMTARTDLIVLRTRDRPESRGRHLGSVSSAVARRATAPVLLIPAAA